MQRGFTTLKQITTFIILLSLSLSGFAQTKRTTVSQTSKATARQTCNGGWSGVVSYRKILKKSVDYGKKKNIARGTTHIKTSDDYEYAGRIIVDGSRGANLLQTKSQVSFKDVSLHWKRYEQNEDCAGDKKDGGNTQWSVSEDSDITNAFSDVAADFSMIVDDWGGVYSFNFRFPEAKGINDRVNKITKGGWCSAKLNEGSDSKKKYPTTVSGEGTEISGKFDPKNPNAISGTKTWKTGDSETGITNYVVTWSLRRCPAPLELEAVEFDENPYPKWNEWRKVDGETVDGNRVRVRARVTNYSSETKFPTLKFIETKASAELPDSATNISIAPGESREVEYLWDTSGWAWETGGVPASDRTVKVEMTEQSAPAKNLSADILIIPRPVILAHGLWADHTSWDGYDKFLKDAHSTSWKSYAVGADPANGEMNTGEKGTWKKSNTIEQNAAELQKQIEAARREKNAWHVDVVAHSMGGLISRHYIHFLMGTVADDNPVVTRLVQLGTPNMGSPCANLMGFTFWALQRPVTSLEQLRPVFLERFNRAVRNRKGTRFSVLIGNPLPQTCQSGIWGDGVVEIPSARWEIRDYRYSSSLHTDLTSRENFNRFVKPRLAVSWRGNHKPDTDYQARNRNEARFINASFQREDDKPILPENLKVELAKEVALQPKQATEIEIPVTANANAGITFIAAPTISALLTDEKGALVGNSLANSPAAKSDFRGFPVQPKTNGVWKLKLENTGATATSVIVAAWTDSSPLPLRLTLETGKPNAAGQIALTAKLTDNSSPATNATIKARVKFDDGKTIDLTLLDDGRSGDGAAGDGIYGTSVEKLANGDYTIEAVASYDNRNAIAATALTIGTETKPIKARK
ncbi:MAG TPA: choice-of-anchor X domain-containing protein [Blastocatellia bacterium]|nr:choice-of-anchor X domain-containing protein [Blastocatellia bacterium]